MSQSFTPPSSVSLARPRVRAIVALRLLEVLREQDRPGEIMEEEDPTVTLPRRFGLSDVVERQIRTHREDVRRGVRLSDAEIRDLFRLVIRRPDAEEVFHRVGRVLAGEGRVAGPWFRRLPRLLAYAVARSRTRKKLRRLFGRNVGAFGRGFFTLEGRGLPFIEADPGGDACAFLTGFCHAVLAGGGGEGARVRHTLCQSRGDEICRWEGEMVEGVELALREEEDSQETADMEVERDG
ncbi:MAG: hypothetical protein ACE5GJ_01515 [Gemmatimonadota bacterium]